VWRRSRVIGGHSYFIDPTVCHRLVRWLAQLCQHISVGRHEALQIPKEVVFYRSVVPVPRHCRRRFKRHVEHKVTPHSPGLRLSFSLRCLSIAMSRTRANSRGKSPDASRCSPPSCRICQMRRPPRQRPEYDTIACSRTTHMMLRDFAGKRVRRAGFVPLSPP
jgi:hypothetical protein